MSQSNTVPGSKAPVQNSTGVPHTAPDVRPRGLFATFCWIITLGWMRPSRSPSTASEAQAQIGELEPLGGTQRPTRLALEPRIIFDAAAAATAEQTADQVAEQQAAAHVSDSDHAFAASREPEAIADRPPEGADHAIAFVDSQIDAPHELISALPGGVEVVLLDATGDGMAQIASTLADRHDVSAIHILAHGGQGHLQLGNAVLDIASMQAQHADALSVVAQALSDDGDILIYGCDFTGGADGLAAATVLGGLTGADIAASDDATGHADFAGDWELETEIGEVNAAPVQAPDWRGVLAVEAADPPLVIENADQSIANNITLSNDGGALSVTTSDTPARVAQMLERVWQYQETIDAGASTLIFDIDGVSGVLGKSATQFGLIISDTPDLSGPDTRVLVASGFEAADNLVYFHNVDLDDGSYITLATKTEPDNYSVSPLVVGQEDNPIDLGLVLSPALTSGGSLRDIVGSAVGYRPSNAGATATTFEVPAGTTGIRVTGYSTRDVDTGANDTLNDDYQTLSVSIDLKSGTSSGTLAHIIDQGPNGSDQFSWTNAQLGQSIGTGGGTITGDFSGVSDPTFSIVDGHLLITENHQLQTAYQVEFLTAETSSADFIQTASAVRELNDTAPVVIDIPADSDFLTINVSDAAAGNDFNIEYKGLSRITVDLATLTANGVVFAERGETDARTITYAFEDYDVSNSTIGRVQSSGARVVGDITDNAGVNANPQIYINASGQLVLTRESGFASNFNSLYTVEFFDRKDVGSPADNLGSSADYQFFNSDPSNPTSTLTFNIPEGATTGVFNLSMNGTRPNNTNENMGAGFAIIDLASGTTSGSLFNVRVSNIVDFVSWDAVDFGNVMFADPDTISNHDTVNDFNDRFIANASFNLIDNPDGSQTLTLTVQSNSGDATHFDYFASGQIEWFGPQKFAIAGYPTGGTFDKGFYNPDTQSWELTLAEAASGLAYIPPQHYSGTDQVDLLLTLGPEGETTIVRVEAVLDPISFTVDAASGDEDTEIAISAAIDPVFVDTDGSESVTSVSLSGIPVGHTVSDGVNAFTARAGQQTIDVTAWNRSNLTYRAPANVFGTFSIDVDVDYQDVGGGVTDTGQTTSRFNVTVNPVNDPPIAENDSYAGIRDQNIVVGAAQGLLANDRDPDNSINPGTDTLSVIVTPVAPPNNGTVTLNTDGSFVYVPDTGFVGTDQFVYRVSDDHGGSTTATVAIEVSPAVEGPLDLADDAAVTSEETPVRVNVYDNDDLPTRGAFVISATGAPANGQIVVNADQTITYTPDVDFIGVDTFTYTVTDADNRTDTATVTVEVTNVQDPPVARVDSRTTTEDVALPSIDVLANDTDADNDTLSVVSARADAGTVSINADGTLNYVPPLNASGTDEITYTISDGNGGFATTTVLITIRAANDAPTTQDQTVTTQEDQEYVFQASDFAFDDVDPGDIIAGIRIETLPSDGTLLLQGRPVTAGQQILPSDLAASRLVFRPDANEFGNDYAEFTFSVTDGVLYSDVGTVTVNVTPVQDPPTAIDDAATTDEDSVLTAQVLGNDSDVDGDAVSVVAINGNPALVGRATTLASGAVVTLLADGTFSYDPNGAFEYLADGETAADTFTYAISDGNGGTDTATVTITVSGIDDVLTIVGVNDGPVAGTDAQVLESDLPTGTNSPGRGETVNAAFTIAPGDGLSVLVVEGQAITASALGLSATSPIDITTDRGLLTIGGYDAASGEVRYSYTLAGAVDHSAGPVIDSIDLQLADRDGDTAFATLGILVVDDAPVANTDTDEAINAAGNPSSVAFGNVFTGVEPGQDPNTTDGVADSLGADGAATALTGVVAGTGAAAGSSASLGQPLAGAYGTLVLSADGAYRYTPDYANGAVAALTPTTSLTDTFTYEITDGDGQTATAQLNIRIVGTPAVIGLGDGAIAGTDAALLEGDLAGGSNAAGAGESHNGSFQVVAPNGVGALEVGAVTLSAADLANLSATSPATIAMTYGTLSLTGFDAATGTIDYHFTLDSAADHSGGAVSDYIDIAVANVFGDRGTGRLAFEIVDDAPVAQDDNGSVIEDTAPATSGDVTANDQVGADARLAPVVGVVAGNGDAASAGGIGSTVAGTYGSLTLQADGTYAYALATGSNVVDALALGEVVTDVFTYALRDGDGDLTQALLSIAITGTNDAPSASNVLTSTQEDDAVSGAIAMSDIDGDAVSAALQSGPANGTAIVNSDGTYTYTPAPDFNGTDSFDVRVSDANGAAITVTVTVVVSAGDDAFDDNTTTAEDTPVTGQAAANDTHAGPATYAIQTQPTNGSARIQSGGFFTYTPNADFHGTDTFEYVVTDAFGGFEIQTVTIVVTPVNDAPTASTAALTTREDTPADGSILMADVDGDTLTATLETAPANGSVVVNPDGTFTYTPAPDFFGTDGFTVLVSDGNGGTVTVSVPVSVSDVDDANDDAFTTAEDVTLFGDVAANDGFAGPASYAVVTGTQDGAVSLNGDGTFAYAPNANFNGSDTFTYRVTDQHGNSETQQVTITVTPMNDPPIAAVDTVSVLEDTRAALNPTLPSDVDNIDATLSIRVDQVPAASQGQVALADGTPVSLGMALTPAQFAGLTFTPSPDYDGAVDPVKYTVSDLAGAQDQGEIRITITPQNDAPVANPDTFAGQEDAQITGNVLLNDSDIDSANLVVADGDGVAGNGLSPVAGPSKGTVVLNADGTFVYTPVADFHGTDSFTYRISDGAGGLHEAQVTLTVAPVRDIVADAATTNEDTPVTIAVQSNDTFEGPVSLAGVTQGAHGVVVANADGTVTFTPAADFQGTDTFEYSVRDAHGNIERALVTVTVNNTTDAAPDARTTAEDTAVDIDVLANDAFAGAATVVSFSQPANGSVNQNPDGTLKYTPAADFHGVDTFTYDVADAFGNLEQASVTVTVEPVVDVVDDTTATDEDTAIDIDVFANDQFEGPASVASVTQPRLGSVSLNGDGSVRYVPAPDFHGSETFTYAVTDAHGNSETAQVTVTVRAVADTVDDAATTNEDTPIDISVLANDRFSGAAVVTDVTQPATGRVVVNANGTVTYTPAADFHGTETFRYTATDVTGQTETAQVTVTVNAISDTVPDTAATTEDAATVIDVQANDNFEGPVTVSAVTQPGKGTVSINGDGTLSYTPAADFHGTEAFSYTLQDPFGNTEVASVQVTVTAVDDTVDDHATTNEDTPVNIDVLGNDTFAGPASVESVTQGAHGSVTLNPDGTVRYVPSPNFHGSDRFTYTARDAHGNRETATVTLVITPVQDDPIARDDTFITDEDAEVAISVLANDTDADGQALSVTAVDGQPISAGQTIILGSGDGSATLNADGTLTFRPAENFNGPATFDYTVSDGISTTTATVRGTVTPVDDPLAITNLDDRPSGGDGEVAEAGLATGSAPGNSRVTSGSFTLAMADGLTALNVGGQTLSAAVLANVDAAPITVTSGRLGDLVIDGFDPITGDVSYTYTLTAPDDHSSGGGVETFALSYSDGDGQSATGQLIIAIIDDAPVLEDDRDEAVNTAGNPSSVASGNVFTGVDAGGDPNTLDGSADATGADGASPLITAVAAGSGTPGSFLGSAVVTGAYGTLTIADDGAYRYTPNYADPTVAGLTPPATLTDRFTYRVVDGDGDAATATIDIVIRGTPAIVGLGDGAVANTDGSVLEADLASGSNPLGTGEAISGSFVLASDHGVRSLEIGGRSLSQAQLLDANSVPVDIDMTFGVLTVTGYSVDTGMVSYTYTLQTPADHSAGAVNDSIALRVTSDLGDQSNAVLRIDIRDDAPITANDSDTVTEDALGANGFASGNVTNGVDAAGDTNATDGAADTQGADGFANPVVIGVGAGANQPNAGSVGAPLRGMYGTLTLNADGSYRYDLDNANPAVNALAAGETSLNDSFRYEITDTDGSKATAQLTIAIIGANDAPTLGADVFETQEDTDVTLNLLANDTDPETDKLSLKSIDGQTVVIGSTIALRDGTGQVRVNANGTITFEPAADYHGPITFTYEVTDGSATTASTVTGTVRPAPDAADDRASVAEDGKVKIAPLANDRFATMARVTAVSQPSNGSAVVNADGTVSYTPQADFHGADSFTYTATDAFGRSETATVRVAVTPVADTSDDFAQTVEDRAVSMRVIANDTFEGPVSIARVSQPANGSVQINAGGAVTYTPNAGFSGNDAFTYTVLDAHGNTEHAIVTIEVTATPKIVAEGDGNGVNAQSPAPTLETPSDPAANIAAPDRFGADLIILDTVADIRRLFENAQETFENSFSSFDAVQFQGFSLQIQMGDVDTNLGEGLRDLLIVETLKHDYVIYVEARQTDNSDAAKRIKSVVFLKDDGQPLPQWVRQADYRLLLAEYPVEQKEMRMKVLATHLDGSVTVKVVRIDLTTAAVQEIRAEQTVHPPLFTRQLTTAVGNRR